MTAFVRIEARISDRAELKRVAQEAGILATRLQAIAHDPRHDDEAALLLARDRIKQASQKMRKGLNDVD